MTLQRVYLYLVSAAALVLLAIGLAVLGATILQFAFRDPKADSNRVAVSTAIGIVALTVWSVHFWLAQRLAHRNPYERRSVIRRLYLYFACLVFSIAAIAS